jgi:hypothetical protein
MSGTSVSEGNPFSIDAIKRDPDGGLDRPQSGNDGGSGGPRTSLPAGDPSASLAVLTDRVERACHPNSDRAEMPTGDPILSDTEWQANTNGYFLKGSQQIGNNPGNHGSTGPNVAGSVKADAGFCLEGGNLVVSAGKLEFAGTPDNPCVLIGVRLVCEQSGTVKAENTIFKNCAFEKGGTLQWKAGFNSRWVFNDCAIQNSNFRNFNADQIGIKFTHSAFIGCDFPRRHMWKQGGDSAAVASAEWSTIRQCDFYQCQLAPSATWSMERCNCFHCSVSGNDQDAFNSSTNLFINLGLSIGDEGLIDELRAKTVTHDTGAVTYKAVPLVDGNGDGISRGKAAETEPGK